MARHIHIHLKTKTRDTSKAEDTVLQYKGWTVRYDPWTSGATAFKGEMHLEAEDVTILKRKIDAKEVGRDTESHFVAEEIKRLEKEAEAASVEAERLFDEIRQSPRLPGRNTKAQQATQSARRAVELARQAVGLAETSGNRDLAIRLRSLVTKYIARAPL